MVKTTSELTQLLIKNNAADYPQLSLRYCEGSASLATPSLVKVIKDQVPDVSLCLAMESCLASLSISFPDVRQV